MAYAALADVQARAGALSGAWTDTSKPSLYDLDGFLADIAAEIDAALAGRGLVIGDPTEPSTLIVGATPLLVDFSTLADAIPFENENWLAFPTDNSISVVSGVATPTRAGTFPGHNVVNGYDLYATPFGVTQEAWGVIARLPEVNAAWQSISLDASDNLGGPAEQSGGGATPVGEIGWVLEIHADGGANSSHEQDWPGITIPAGTFQVGDRVGISVLPTTAVIWRDRGTGPVVVATNDDASWTRSGGYLTFGAQGDADSPNPQGAWAKIGGGTLDPTASTPALALKNTNALGGLVLALQATYPEGAGPASASKAIDDAKAEFDVLMAAIQDGSHPAVRALEGAAAANRATSFWQQEPLYGEYPFDPRLDPTSPDANPWTAPAFARGQRL